MRDNIESSYYEAEKCEEQKGMQTWNHLACLSAAKASRHFCLSKTSGGSGFVVWLASVVETNGKCVCEKAWQAPKRLTLYRINNLWKIKFLLA